MKKIVVLAVLAVAVFAALPAFASCLPDKQFGSLGSTGAFGYAYLPNNPTGTHFVPGTVVGRFWTPGLRSTANEGTYSADTWFLPYGATNQFYINGFLGAEGPLGCVAGEMLMVVQAKTLTPAANQPSGQVLPDVKGSSFLAVRVAETFEGAVSFDFTRLSLQFNAVPITAPTVAIASKAGSLLSLNITGASVVSGLTGETGANPTATLSGLRLMRAFGSAPPEPNASGWVFLNQTVPAAGGSIGPFGFDCALAPAGQDLFLAWQVSFNSGEVLGDYVGTSTQVRCNSSLANPNKFKNIDKKPKK